MALRACCYVLVVLVTVINLVKCFPDGAPVSTCDSMMPSHDTESQTTPPNYNISLSADTVQAGDTIKVRFMADPDHPFKGILLKALSTNSNTGAAGSFQIGDTDLSLYQTLNCSDLPASAITHTSDSPKTDVEVDWTAPIINGNYMFIATVVENYTTFWAAENGVKSESVEVMGGSTIGTTVTSLPPAFDYDLCWVDRNCMGYPSMDCISSKTCTMLLTFHPTPDEETVSFELFSSLNGYAALGLSSDDNMGDDSVLECLTSTPVTMYASINVGHGNHKGNDESQQVAFVMDEGTFIDGILSCKFRRNITTVVISAESPSDQITTDMGNENYYLLLAAGPMTSDEKDIDRHTDRISSESAFNLTSNNFIVPATSPATTSVTAPPPPFDYDLCSVDRSCMGFPSTDCISSKTCSMLLTFRPTPGEETVSFELFSSLNGYAALGLSSDETMGDDSVLECLASTPVAMYASINIGHVNYKANDESQQDAFTLDEGTYIDGILSCKFRRDMTTDVTSSESNDHITTDMENQNYFLLLAYGLMTSDEKDIDVHTDHIATDTAINLTSYDFIIPVSDPGSLPIEIIMHGSLMVVSWIALSSIAVFLARFYKDMWPDKKLCNNKLWFAYHRGLNMANVVITLVAFVVILVYSLKNDAFEQDAHPITGLITIILVVLQPIGAYFRPHPGTPKREIFNWLHFLAGMLACCFGVITIYLAVRLKQSHLPTYFYYIVTGFVAFYLLMFCCMEFLIYRSERKKVLQITDIAMQLPNGDEPKDEPSQAVKDIVKPQKIHFYKKILLGLFVCGVVGFAIAMISIIAIS